MRVALYGGSFDPPHLGHVLAVAYAYATSKVDKVWVLPVWKHAYSKQMAAFEDRLALCEAAFGGLGFAEVRDDERRNEAGYSVTLVELLRAEHPDHEFLWVGGSDVVHDLANWHRGADLRRLLAGVVPVPREGSLRPAAGDAGEAGDASDADRPESGFAVPNFSSTLVRQRLRDPATRTAAQLAALLPVRVVDLVLANNWYPPQP